MGKFGPKLAKIGFARNAFFCAGAHTGARGLIFQHLIGIEVSWGSAVEIKKIGPTVAE